MMRYLHIFSFPVYWSVLLIPTAQKDLQNSCFSILSCNQCVQRNCYYIDVGIGRLGHWVCVPTLKGLSNVRFLVTNKREEFCPEPPPLRTFKQTLKPTMLPTTVKPTTIPQASTFSTIQLASVLSAALAVVFGGVAYVAWRQKKKGRTSPLVVQPNTTFRQRRVDHRRELRERYEIRNEQFLRHIPERMESIPPNFVAQLPISPLILQRSLSLPPNRHAFAEVHPLQNRSPSVPPSSLPLVMSKISLKVIQSAYANFFDSTVDDVD